MMNSLNTFLFSHKKAAIICITALLCVVVIVSIIASNNSTIHTVTFYSDDHSVILVDKVKHNQSAEPPIVPELTYGNIFTKWDKDISNVTSNLDVYPEYESVLGKDNTFTLQGAYGKVGENVSVPLMLCGDVKISGFDAEIEYDPDNLEFDSAANPDGDALVNNPEPGKIKINFVSTNNVTADVDICFLKLILKKDVDQTPLTIKINSIYAVDEDGELFVPEYNTVDSNVFVVQ